MAENYKGIFLGEGIVNDRKSNAYYNGELYESWWMNEYKTGPKKVFIFQKPLYVRYQGKKINKPFKGRTFQENDFTENDYTEWSDGVNNTKILKIDNVQTFDKFTNKYGYILKNNKIGIIWKKVNNDWKGFYFDKDSFTDFYLHRFKKAFYNGKKYDSWWSNEDIYIGFVYVFN